jgi:hypothetical protein
MHTTLEKKSQKGFVILFAVLISAIILLIGTGILGITVKETILASTARESQLAINAADTGVECMLYYKFVTEPLFPGTPVNCVGNSVAYAPTIELEITDSQQRNMCSRVSVSTGPSPTPPLQEIKILSQGFNICSNESPDMSDPLLLERVYRVIYFQ